MLRQRGAALLLVLWVTALLTVMAATLLLLVKRSGDGAQQLLARTQAQALADSADQRVIWALIAADPAQHPPLDGQLHPVEVVGGRAAAAVSDEAGRIDLNTTSPQLLDALFIAAGADALQAGAVAAGVVRTRKSDPSAGGAQTGGLLEVADLLGISGMTPALYAQLQPAVTVYTRAPAVDQRYAPALVAEALRRTGAASPATDLQAARTADEQHSLAGRVLRIAVRITTDGGAQWSTTDVVRLTGDSQRPFWMLDREEEVAE